MMRRLLAVALVAGVLAIPATAQAVDTCPEGSGWVKVEGLSGLSYTFTVPEGFDVTQNCMKVGSHPVLFGSGDTVTNSSLFNSPGGAVCTAPGVPVEGCALQGISHASFLLVEEPPDDPEPTTTTTQPQGDPEPTTTTTIGSTSTTVDDGTTTTIAAGTSTLPPTTTAPTVTTVPTEGTLPFTGAETGMLAGLGLSALALGGLLLSAVRTRKEQA